MFADAPSHLTECRITGPLLWSNTDRMLMLSIIAHLLKLLWDQLLIYAMNGAAAVIKDELCSELCSRNIAHFLQRSGKLCNITDAKFVVTQASSFWNQCVLLFVLVIFFAENCATSSSRYTTCVPIWFSKNYFLVLNYSARCCARYWSKYFLWTSFSYNVTSGHVAYTYIYRNIINISEFLKSSSFCLCIFVDWFDVK